MTIATSSLNAQARLPGTLGLCSWSRGWRSLLLRSYSEPADIDGLVTSATSDHLIVLVTRGRCLIEGRYEGRWHQSHYGVGDLGMTASGEEVELRWRAGKALETLQLHLPATMIADVARLDPAHTDGSRLPNQLLRPDPVVRAVMASLAQGVEAGMSEIHAEIAGMFLASHLLQAHGASASPRLARIDDRRLAQVDQQLRECLDRPLSLDDLARTAGLSKFHLLRAFRRRYGETPGQRLTRYRMEEARRLLGTTDEPVTAIAFACGYGSSAYFASAFRRKFGISPGQCRALVRRY